MNNEFCFIFFIFIELKKVIQGFSYEIAKFRQGRSGKFTERRVLKVYFLCRTFVP